LDNTEGTVADSQSNLVVCEGSIYAEHPQGDC
jgi:hypothetical protein